MPTPTLTNTPSSTSAVSQMPPVCKELVVRCRPQLAFDVFTARMSDWWPLATHSVGAEEAQSVAIEPEEGGRLFETCADGAEHVWGHVTYWDPPAGFDCTWHPGREADAATRLSLRFHPVEDGTRVVLEHAGWEILGDEAEATRNGYDGGWESVFGEAYASAVVAAAGEGRAS